MCKTRIITIALLTLFNCVARGIQCGGTQKVSHLRWKSMCGAFGCPRLALEYGVVRGPYSPMH